MKKILTLLLILALTVSVFAGCAKIKDIFGKNKTDDTDTSTGDNNQGNEPGDEPGDEPGNEPGDEPGNEPGDEPAEDLLADARAYVHQMYKDTIGKQTPANITLGTIASVNDKNGTSHSFTITWTVNNDQISIIPGETENTVIVVVPEPVEDIPYVLTFTITDADGKTVSRDYEVVVPKFAFTTFAEYAAAEDDAPVAIAGVVTGVISKTTGSQANGLYIQDLNNEGGYYVYNLTDDVYETVKPGMTVKVKGVKDTYNGTYEVVNASVEIVDSEINLVTPVDYTDLVANAGALDAAELVEKQGMLVTIKGVTILEAGDNGYYYFQAGNHKTYLRISSSNNPTSKDALDAIKALHAANYGNTADVTGVISIYSGKFYLSPVSADAFSNVQVVEKTDAEKVATELDLVKLVDALASSTTLTLPTAGSSYSDVVLSWASDNAAAVVDGGKLVITLPEANATVTLTVTATCGEATDSKTLTIKLVATQTSIADALEIGGAKDHNTYTEDKHVVTGVVKTEPNATYGNTVIVDADGNELTLYGLYSADGSLRYDKFDVKIAAGDTITVFGVLGTYNGTIQMKNGWVVAHTPGEGGGEDPDPDPDPNPNFDLELDTAYKFGMYQGNVGKTYYLLGGMDGYYLATTEDISAALDVYLEATTGGYHLYCYVDGVKTYINFVVSGTHVNGAYEATASTVYTYDSTTKTVIASVEGEDYWLATRNDKNYTTMGPCKVSYEGFYGQFVSENETPACDHTDTEETVVNATCTTDGSKTVTCKDCGEILSTETLTATGHNHEAAVTAPTCTAAGYTTYTCACGDTYTEEGEAALGHTEGDAATCETAQTCTVCGETLVAALGHAYVNGSCVVCGFCENHNIEQNFFYHPELVAATCTETGVAVFECTVCDYYYTEVAPIDPEAHMWDNENAEIVTPANCATQTDGVKIVKCIRCDATEEREIYYYEVHNMDVQVNIPATCTTDGEYYAVCTLCGLVEEYHTEAQGHDNWYLTCGETGACMECGEEFTKPDHEGSPATCTEAMFCYNCFEFVGEPLGHSYVDGVCSNCGESESGPVTAVVLGTYLGTDDFGNQFLTVVVDETTVTFTFNHPKMGSTTVVANYYVEAGEVVLIDPATENILHPLSGALYINAEGLPTSAAYNGNNYTLLAEGAGAPVSPELVLGENTLVINDTWNGDVYTFTATEDGTYNFVVGTNGMLIVENDTGADAYFVGDTYSVECVAGGIVTVRVAVSDSTSNVAVITVEFVAAVPACQHNSVTPTKVDATCTADGSYTVVCDDCGETVYSEVLTATGHSHEADVTAPTCTEAGYTTYTCACGDTYTGDEVAATGHNHEADVTAPTCTEAGYTTYTCACGDTYTGDEVAATGHTYTDGICEGCNAINYGTLEAPLSTTVAYNLCKGFAEDEVSADLFYVQGTVTAIGSTGSYYKNVYITDGTTELLIYSINLGDGITGFTVGDTIIAYGYIKNYKGTIEMAGNGSVYVYAVSVEAHEHNYEAVVTEPTCTEDGYTTHTCSICKDSYVDSEVETSGHSYADGVCTECGHEEGAAEVEPSYVKITSADQLTTGTYVLIIENKNVTMSTYDGSWIKGTALTAGDSIDKATGDAYAITLTVTDAGVVITIGGQDVAPKGGNNNGIKSSTYNWAYEFVDGKILFKGTGSDTVYLAYNVQSAGYRGYKTATVNGNPGGYPSHFTIYKLV